jgi:hypothetical protein
MQMKRIPRDPEKFETINLFDSMGRIHNLSLNDEESEKLFVDYIRASLRENKKIPILIYGGRVERMFGFVAASLGKCRVIAQEDSGEIYSIKNDITPPDYHILLENGEDLFVEVKNCNHAKPSKPFSLRSVYVNRLLNYGRAFRKEVKLAIYWSRWNTWALLSLDRLKKANKHWEIDLATALKVNEMELFGDYMIGTTPPLTFRLITDPRKPRKVMETGQVDFTIGRVELYCGTKRIKDKKEIQIAFYMMMYGRWPTKDPRPFVENGELIAVEYVCEPEEKVAEQGFDIVGSLSGMISRRYDELTAPDGTVTRLTPGVEPGILGIDIDKEYVGEHLPLWRFIQKPRLEPT